MRPLLPSNKNAVSTIVAYVLLISITVSLSVMVFNWLRFYVGEKEIAQCPDAVDVIIENYDCVSGGNGFLNITLKNKGRFSVDGYVLRVNDKANAEFGFYVLNKTGSSFSPGERVEGVYFFNKSYGGKKFTALTLVEVQPFLMKGEKINCKSYAYQKIKCH